MAGKTKGPVQPMTAPPKKKAAAKKVAKNAPAEKVAAKKTAAKKTVAGPSAMTRVIAKVKKLVARK
jgi:hypothetical protein